MTRMTKTITLVLVGSTVLLSGMFMAGCFSPRREEKEKEQAGVATGGTTQVRHHYHRSYWNPWLFSRRWGNSGWSSSPGGSAISGRPSTSSSSSGIVSRSGGFGTTGRSVSS
ncbi:MAG: hypothetical protein ACKO23_11640 [Gemmataceae bacterium]